MRWLSAILVIIAFAVAGCSHKGYAADDKSKVHVGIVFDIGGKDDRSFNAAAWEGVRRAAKDFPIVLRDVEPGDPTSIEPAMRAFAERGYDLIIGVGFSQTRNYRSRRERLSVLELRHHRWSEPAAERRIAHFQRARRLLSCRHDCRHDVENRDDRFSRRYGYSTDPQIRSRIRRRREGSQSEDPRHPELHRRDRFRLE